MFSATTTLDIFFVFLGSGLEVSRMIFVIPFFIGFRLRVPVVFAATSGFVASLFDRLVYLSLIHI